MMFDPLRFTIALGPLALYFLVLGRINLRSQPTVISGTRDAAALAIAVSGLFIIGPIELFLPATAADNFGPVAWLMICILYGLIVLLSILGQRPRLVIYNIDPAEFRQAFAQLCQRLDPAARWAGDNVELPSCGLDLRLQASLRNVTIIAQGEPVPFQPWRDLEQAVAAEFAPRAGRPNPRGAMLLGIGLAMLAAVIYQLSTEPQTVASLFTKMFRL
jgi:hypothetical protein